jgi:predicted Zn-dependent protease
MPRWVVVALALSVSALSPVDARAQASPDPAQGSRAPGVSFEALSRQAEEAWAAGRSDEALRLFRAGLDLNPEWRDGWWRLGQINANGGRYADAREALLRLVRLEPDAGPAWALLGLCEYRLQAYDRALAYLWKGTSLGVDDDALQREALLHFALLLVRTGDFASAVKPLARLLTRRSDDPDLVWACGLLALRMPRLPFEVPEAERDLVATAGRAGCAALARRDEEARQGFQALVSRYPKTRGVHFIYGLFLRGAASPEGLAELRREVELFPDNAEACATIAFEILERGTPADALAPARAAARLAPDLGASHLAYGRALVATGAVDEGIAELEQAARMAPEDRDVYLALAQAYAAAGRAADVARARARLLELDKGRGARPE